MLKLSTYSPAGARVKGLGIVPRPRRMDRSVRTRPFIVGPRANVICPRNGRGLRQATRFLTSCVGRTAKVAIQAAARTTEGGSVVLTISNSVAGGRKCRLRMASRGVRLGKKDRSKMFCKVRALCGTLPLAGGGRMSTTVPIKAIGSCPHFNCHNFVMSINHRCFPISCLGRVVSVLTLRGVGCFR